MATRENQGLQAIIIVLTILVIGLLVGLLLVNNARKTAIGRASTAEDNARSANTALSQAQGEANTYKTMMGFQEGDSLDAIRTAYDADMAQYAASLEEGMRMYRVVRESLFGEKNALQVNEATAKDELKKLSARLLAVEAQKEQQVKKFQEEMERIRADAAAARTQFDDDRARMTAENDSYQKKLRDLQAEHDEALARLSTEKVSLETQIAKQQQSIEKLRLGLPEVDQFAQPSDGRITWVNQRYGTVWINIGEADGLRPQVTFSVSAAGLDDAAAAEKKGSIEVTRILGPHMAEAKVTSDASTNPLLPGDCIYSQVWDRGRQVGFGIAGFIDIDGDGRNDLEKLKNIIAANGGVVDAAPDDAGAKQGELKVTTRYLILGEFPSEARSTALRQSWNELSAEAENLGIQTIALEEFLSLMGWQSEARTVPMGPEARAEDFPPSARTQEMPRRTGHPSGVFKPRLPSVTY
ncbi:MAG TPA: hypothetical protein PJ982_12170 [Lacipirellulaceae bacterium]|nr:hypothetical protein [Lacipirellulaceae bacterium]